MYKPLGLILAGIGGLVANASAVLINFDDGQPNNAAIGSFYSGLGVTFTDAKWRFADGIPGASGEQGCSSISSTGFPQQANPIRASFSFLVSSVTLRGIDVGIRGFRLKAFDTSNVLIDNQVVFGTGDGVDQFYDLTVTGLISRIEWSQDNADPIGEGMFVDNLQFTPAPVPEPGTMAILALGATVFLKRKRK